MSPLPTGTRKWTAAEYLAMERAAATKHELFGNEVFAMAGASREHNLIVANVAGELREKLRARPCEVYAADMRVQVAATGLYTYPDVTVVCGGARFEDEQKDTLLNPVVIVEVLSDSTESYDRGKKFEQYRTVASLAEYVLVSQKEALIEHFVRQPDGSWLLRERRGGDRLELAALGCAIELGEVYLKVFDAQTG